MASPMSDTSSQASAQAVDAPQFPENAPAVEAGPSVQASVPAPVPATVPANGTSRAANYTATNNGSTSQGEKLLPHCETVLHAYNYPLIQEAEWAVFKSNPMGRTALDFLTWEYDTFGKPILRIAWKFPHEFAVPAAKSVDSLSLRILNTVDHYAPITQMNAWQICAASWHKVTLPYRLTKKGIFLTYTGAMITYNAMGKTADRYTDIFESEKGKIGKTSVRNKGVAAVTSGLLLGSEGLVIARDYVVDVADRARLTVSEAANAAATAANAAARAAAGAATGAVGAISAAAGAVGSAAATAAGVVDKGKHNVEQIASKMAAQEA